MSKRPWMPLYVADYLADTMHLNATQSGAYLHLIMHYWQHGKLPTDERALARIAKIDNRQWHFYRNSILSFFVVNVAPLGGVTLQHTRVDNELLRSSDLSNKRKEAAIQMHRLHPAKAKQKHTQSQSHIQRKKEDKKEQPAQESRVFDLEKPPSIFDWPEDYREQFWNSYPHKVGKPTALASLDRVKRKGKVTFDFLLFGLEKYKTQKPAERAWCNPSTWLNQERWTDEPAAENHGGKNGNGTRYTKPGNEAGMAEALARRNQGGLFFSDNSGKPIIDGTATEIRAIGNSELKEI